MQTINNLEIGHNLQHEVVWVQIDDSAWWPGVIMPQKSDYNNNKYYAHLFANQHSEILVSYDQICKFELLSQKQCLSDPSQELQLAMKQASSLWDKLRQIESSQNQSSNITPNLDNSTGQNTQSLHNQDILLKVGIQSNQSPQGNRRKTKSISKQNQNVEGHKRRRGRPHKQQNQQKIKEILQGYKLYTIPLPQNQMDLTPKICRKICKILKHKGIEGTKAHLLSLKFKQHVHNGKDLIRIVQHLQNESADNYNPM